MPAWMWNADLLITIATVLTAAFGLLTAVVSFKKARRPEQAHAAETPADDQLAADTSASLRLVRLEGPPSRPWPRRWLKFAVVVSGIISATFVVLALFSLIYTGSRDQLFPLAFFGGCLVIYATLGKRLLNDCVRSSWAKREATLKIQGSFDKLWDECISALNKTGAEIKSIDRDRGLIEGKIGWRWNSLGETIAVQISAAGPNMFDVYVKSDSILNITAVDYGRNASNIQRFTRELVR